jgi:hypothetical protein
MTDERRRIAVGRGSGTQNIPGIFQLVIALYLLLTGDVPTIIQAVSFGLRGGADTEFALAMISSITHTLLLLAAVMMLARHPLGILHPLLLAVVVWPLLASFPSTIEQYGGWLGVLQGVPVETPRYLGLHMFDPAKVWLAETKFSLVRIVALLGTFAGFWLFVPKRGLVKRAVAPLDSGGIRNAMLGLFVLSVIVFVIYIYFRGGLVAHLTALGRGRFRELAGLGVIVVTIQFAAVSMYVWIAARPGDIKSPLFLSCLAVTVITQFAKDGSRGSALSVLVLTGLVWALRRRSVPGKIPILLIPVMFLSLGLLGAVRTASWNGSTAAEAWSTTTWQQSMAIAQEEVASRREASANIPVVARGFEVSGGPLLGMSYLAAITAWFPRAFWENKPRGAGSLYAQTFLGASREGLAIPVGPEAEMYWNFGWPGLVVLSIVYGALLQVAYRFFWRRYPDPFAVVFFVLFATAFQFSADRRVQFQQNVGLLAICYVAASLLAARRPVMSPTPRARPVSAEKRAVAHNIS